MKLPLTDGAFLIDNSALDLLPCPRKFYYSFVRRRSLVSAKAGRNFGSVMHIGWAVRYRHCGSLAVGADIVPEINEAMRDYLDETPQPSDDFRDFNHSCKVMAAYNEHYKNEPFTILTNPKDGQLLVEKSFMLPFMDVRIPADNRDGYIIVPVYYCGKLDLGTKDEHGIWSGPDHKTTFMFGDAFDKQMQRDPGQMGYVWALKQITGIMPRGYIIDAVRIRKPKRDQIFTGEPPVDATDFKRVPVFVDEKALETWKKNTEFKIRMVFHYDSIDYWPEAESQCTSAVPNDTSPYAGPNGSKFGLCDYYDVCSVGIESREAALASTLYEENRWSPLSAPKIVTGEIQK